MHSGKSRWRGIALLAPIAVIVAALALFLGGTGTNVGTQDVSALGDLTGVSCADIYFDLKPIQANKGEPPGPEDFIIGKALTRIEESQTQAGGWDVVSISYLGQDKKDGVDPTAFADLPQDLQDIANLAILAGVFENQAEVLDLIPDQSPSNDNCRTKIANATSFKFIDQKMTLQGAINAAMSLQGAIDNLPTTTALTVVVTKDLAVGEVIQIDDEQMDVTVAPASVAGKQAITVVRAVNGTIIDSHLALASVLTATLTVDVSAAKKDLVVGDIIALEFIDQGMTLNAAIVKGATAVPVDVTGTKALIVGDIIRIDGEEMTVTVAPAPVIGPPDIQTVTIAPATTAHAIGAKVFKFDPEVTTVTAAPARVAGKQNITIAPALVKARAVGEPVLKSATGGPEKNELKVKYATIGNNRPTATAKLVGNNLIWQTCTFSSALGIWIRIDVDSHPIEKDKQAKNFGATTLWFATSSPAVAIDTNADTTLDTAVDPSTCDDTFALPFHSILVIESRKATTDHQIEPSGKNAPLLAAGIITVDQDGPHPKVQGVAQVQDGTVEGSPAASETGGKPDGTCGDTIDNDLDGFIDARDQDCQFLPDDWDGDGCPDWDELDKQFLNGRDPFNPNDCYIFDQFGSFNALVTVSPVSKDAAGVVTPGNFFTCILAQTQPTATTVSGAILCTADTPILTSAPNPDCPAIVPPPGSTCGGSAIPSRANGLPGADVPPYTTGSPTKYTGSISDKILTTNICFPNVGATLGPHLIAQNVIDISTNKGIVNIFTGQTLTNCLAGEPTDNPATPEDESITENGALNQLLSGLRVVLTPQSPSFDHDKDGCSDMEELLDALRTKGCGDDPLNPLDSDGNLDAVAIIQVTVAEDDFCLAGIPIVPCLGADEVVGGTGPDADLADGTRVPGSYFNCSATVDHDKAGPKTAQAITTRVFCYVDSTFIEVNPQNAPGIFGDGTSGTPPPLPFADVDTTHVILTGTYDTNANKVDLEGCFDQVSGLLGPNVYVRATYQPHTGVGTVDIWALRADCTKPATAPTFPDALFELAEQASNKLNDGSDKPSSDHFDLDQDGCSDTNELGPNKSFGGLRDPFNAYDLFDPNGDGSVAFADFLQVLQHFNTNDAQPLAVAANTPLTDPSTVTPAGVYSPRYDRGGAITGSNAWNEDFPNGAIGFPDFLSLLRQFGHTCNADI